MSGPILVIWPIMWQHVTSQYDTVTLCGVTLWRHITNFGAKGLENILCGRCVNAQAFSLISRSDQHLISHQGAILSLAEDQCLLVIPIYTVLFATVWPKRYMLCWTLPTASLFIAQFRGIHSVQAFQLIVRPHTLPYESYPRPHWHQKSP